MVRMGFDEVSTAAGGIVSGVPKSDNGGNACPRASLGGGEGERLKSEASAGRAAADEARREEKKREARFPVLVGVAGGEGRVWVRRVFGGNWRVLASDSTATGASTEMRDIESERKKRMGCWTGRQARQQMRPAFCINNTMRA